MKNLSQEETNKINVLKKIILLKSKFIQKYGINNVSIVLDSYDRDENSDFLELLFSLKITEFYCDDCQFEIENLFHDIQEIQRSLYKACQIGITKNLNHYNGNTLEVIGLNQVVMKFDEFEVLEFVILYRM